MKSITKAIIC